MPIVFSKVRKYDKDKIPTFSKLFLEAFNIEQLRKLKYESSNLVNPFIEISITFNILNSKWLPKASFAGTISVRLLFLKDSYSTLWDRNLLKYEGIEFKFCPDQSTFFEKGVLVKCSLSNKGKDPFAIITGSINTNSSLSVKSISSRRVKPRKSILKENKDLRLEFGPDDSKLG